MSCDSTALPLRWESNLLLEQRRRPVSALVDSSYALHFNAVCRYAYAILRRTHEAEDVAQETFVRMIQSLERGASFENALPWLLRVAHNLAISRIQGRPSEWKLADSDWESLADSAPNPEEAALEEQNRVWLQRTLLQLSPQELRCWTLRAEGLRYREIAEVLEIRTGTVATLLARAAEKLSSASAARQIAVPDADEAELAGRRR